MLVGTEEMVSIIGKVALGGIKDPYQMQTYEDLNKLDDFDFWGDEDEWWRDRGPDFEKAFIFEKNAQIKEAQAKGIDPFATAAVQPKRDAVFNAKRWMRDYENGYIPAEAMDSIGGGHMMRPDAAIAFKALRRAVKKNLGIDIGVTDSYRDFAAQVVLKAQKPDLAATPGKSNHGWGIALDLDVNDPRVFQWLREHGDEYGFTQPMSYEPWHWEYHGGYQGAKNAFRQPRRSQRRQPGVVNHGDPLGVIGAVVDEPAFSAMTALPFGVMGLFGHPTAEVASDKPNRGTGKQMPSFVPKDMRRYFLEASKITGVPVRLLAVVGQKESGFRKDVVSSAGAIGVMQVMPFNAGGVDLYNARQNILQGARILKGYIERAKGDVREGLASYNGGPGNPQYDYADMILDALYDIRRAA